MGSFLSSVPTGVPTTVVLDSAGPVVVAVADGLGGHADGQRASRIVLQTLADAGPVIDTEARLSEVLVAANDATYVEMALHPSLFGMGTTVAGFAFAQDRGWCFNVGDSRCYSLSHGMLIQLSVDDVPPPLPGQDPDIHSSLVTQTLGGAPTPTPITPHLLEIDLGTPTTLLVCTDGLSSYVPIEILERELDKVRSQPEAVLALLKSAFAAGGSDNVSIALITTHPDTSTGEVPL